MGRAPARGRQARGAPPALLTPTQYSRRRGVTLQAVRAAIKTGRIPIVKVGGRKLVDPAIADVAWVENTDPGKPKGRLAKSNGSAPPPDGTQAAEVLKLTGIKARMAQLEYERRSGQLVDAAAAEARYFELVRTARDKLLALADPLGPALVPIKDARTMTLRLREEFTKLAMAIAGEPPEERKRAGTSH